MLQIFKPNPGKELEIHVQNNLITRLPIKTHVITNKDDIIEVVKKYAAEHMKNGDILFMSERVVAITQGRSFAVKDIHPSLFAKFLVKFVYKSPYGIGLGVAETMELAIREAGIFRIILGALAAAVTKPFGIHGVFYKVVGKNVNAIDGPCDYTLPPYNEYATLAPARPNKTARQISHAIGHDVVIIDANDLGVRVLGKSGKHILDDFAEKVFRDNPLGQSTEQTPLCIVRFAE